MALTVAAVETAITAIETGGQSVTLGSITYTAANLQALLNLRSQLQREAEASGATRPVFRAFNFRGAGYNKGGEEPDIDIYLQNP
jgi:hypothetical protein